MRQGSQGVMEEGPGEVHTRNALTEREENNVHREERVAGGGEKYSSLAQGQPGEHKQARQGRGVGSTVAQPQPPGVGSWVPQGELGGP